MERKTKKSLDISKLHIHEQLNAFSSFLKIKMKEPERDPRTSYVFISKENQASAFKEGRVFLQFNRNPPTTLLFYSLKETQASTVQDFHDLHLSLKQQ